MKKEVVLLGLALAAALLSCSKSEEVSLEEAEALAAEGGIDALVAKTVSRPYQGEEFTPGKLGGSWRSVITEDPKSFNLLIAEQDSATGGITDPMLGYLLDYDMVKREWKDHDVSTEIVLYEEADKLDVICTLRDDLFWTWYESDRRVKVTSDDVIFWYNEIRGDPECGSSGYYQQFLEMPDGGEGRIEIEKIDDRRFVFHFPRIVADPLLTINMGINPRMGYEEAKRSGGAEAVRALFNVETDPKSIPSMGRWYLTEYIPGQRLVFKRNPNYWEKDSNGVSIPYHEEEIVRIIPDENTQLLLFKEGQTEDWALRPEDMDEMVNNQEGMKQGGLPGLFNIRRRDTDYTVYNNEGGQTANFWVFNQNPANSDAPHYEWFTKKEFRQAMSCLLNRDRIINQVYRGLASPKLSFFPETNRYYDENIMLRYVYDPQRAEALLGSIGIARDGAGLMRDSRGLAVEFTLTIRSESSVIVDIANILADELSRLGIKLNIQIMDFQSIVAKLFSTFDWESTIMGLSGSNTFPTQGSNVWTSDGNLHMWYPEQESPATSWEARIDELYHKGAYTVGYEEAKPVWDEYQSIILEQCPLIYLVRPKGFWALRNRWDPSNVYYDNRNGAEISHVFLK
jgi:peptide/nickel transport system substrate-binding protein